MLPGNQRVLRLFSLFMVLRISPGHMCLEASILNPATPHPIRVFIHPEMVDRTYSASPEMDSTYHPCLLLKKNRELRMTYTYSCIDELV